MGNNKLLHIIKHYSLVMCFKIVEYTKFVSFPIICYNECTKHNQLLFAQQKLCLIIILFYGRCYSLTFSVKYYLNNENLITTPTPYTYPTYVFYRAPKIILVQIIYNCSRTYYLPKIYRAKYIRTMKTSLPPLTHSPCRPLVPARFFDVN